MFTRYQKKITFFSCLILITSLMAIDFINPSLPYIMQSLKATQSEIKGLIITYMLGFGASQLFYGTYSDNYGRKKTIILSYIIAIIGMILSFFSFSVFTLHIARFITGIGAGGGAVIARAIISDVFHDQVPLKKAFSYFSMSSQLSPAFAPIIGAFIQQISSWRFCFLGLALMTIGSFLILINFMPETHSINKEKTRAKDQIKIYCSLVKLHRFMLFNFQSAFIFVFTIGYYTYMPFILYKLKFSPIENSLMYSIYAAFLVMGSLSLAKYLSKINSEYLFLICSFLFLAYSTSFYLLFIFYHSTLLITLLSIFIAFTCGISAPLTLALCMQGFNKNKGAASAMQSFIKMFFTGIIFLAFNFIALKSINSLLICYMILSVAMLTFFYLNKIVDTICTQNL